MTVEENYFKYRNLVIKSQDRTFLAKREIYTLKFLLKNFYNYEVEKNLNILDLGSGDKFLKSEIDLQECNYFSLDINDINFENEYFKFEKNKFDIVICLSVIEHLTDPNLFLSEIKRVLKNNGYLYIETPNWIYSKNIFYDDPTHKKPYTPKSLNFILKSHKFTNIKLFPNLRCKSKWYYFGKFNFLKARYLLPFRNDQKFIPSFLKGGSKGIFCISQKQDNE